MSIDALNEVEKKIPLFQEIISPLKNNFKLTFGYMFITNDGSYFTLTEGKKCIKEFVTVVDSSSIFCDENISATYDGEYYYTLWPHAPNCSAMEVYFRNNQWNGITISKVKRDFVELWWFAGDKENNHIQHFLSSNKNILIKFIKYFNSFKGLLQIPTASYMPKNLFKFSKGFQITLPTIKPENDLFKVTNFLNCIQTNLFKQKKTLILNEYNLSTRELEVLLILCEGFTAKYIARKLNVSTRTVEHHIEHIKVKTKIHFKSEIIERFKDTLLR